MSYQKTKAKLNLFLAAVLVLVIITLVKSFDAPAARLQRIINNPNVHLYPLKVRNLRLLAEIARTPAEKERGLSSRQRLPEFQGMLFVFPQDTRPVFWMKETLFPLDLLWIDRDLRIVEITPNISPATYPQTFSPRRPIRYVLEINAGLVNDFNIRPGDWLVI